MRKLIKEISEFDKDNLTNITISGKIQRVDCEAREEVNNLIEKLQKMCRNKDISFVDNDNIGNSCLNYYS